MELHGHRRGLGTIAQDRLGTAERITEWHRIIAFRNQLIHGYGVIKNELTWDIVQSKLPVLRRDVQTLLGLR